MQIFNKATTENISLIEKKITIIDCYKETGVIGIPITYRAVFKCFCLLSLPIHYASQFEYSKGKVISYNAKYKRVQSNFNDATLKKTKELELQKNNLNNSIINHLE